MKKFVIVAFALLSTSLAFGAKYSKETPWSVLNKAHDLEIAMPVVFMGHAVSYGFVCQEGSMFRTKKMVDIVKTEYGREHNKTTVIGKEYLTTPIHYTRTVSDCRYIGKDRQLCEDKVITGTYPTTVNVKVYEIPRARNATENKYLFTKSYTVPQCD